MNYAEIYVAATDENHVLRKQVAVALNKAAVDISNEGDVDVLHNDRITWAKRVFLDPTAAAKKYIWKVLENETIAAAPGTSPDSDVQFVVNSFVNKTLHF